MLNTRGKSGAMGNGVGDFGCFVFVEKRGADHEFVREKRGADHEFVREKRGADHEFVREIRGADHEFVHEKTRG